MAITNGQLTLFWGITPNKGTYIIPNQRVAAESLSNDPWGWAMYSWLFTQTVEYQTRMILQIGSYKVYEGYIDIPQSIGTPPEYNAVIKNIAYVTYIAIQAANKYRFYFVNNVELLSDRTRLYIELDTWGTYIGYADIKNIRVLTSNIQIAAEDEIPYRIPEFSYYNNALIHKYYALGINNRIQRNDLRIYAVIRHQVYKNFSVSAEVINTYKFDPHDITGNTGQLTKDDILKSFNWVSNIWQLSESIMGVENVFTGSAEVMHIYIYPDLGSYGDGAYEFSGIYNGKKKNVDGSIVTPSGSGFNIIFGNGVNYTPLLPSQSPYVEIPGLGREIYFGTYYNGIKLPSFAGCLGVKFNIQVLNDRMLFIVEANGEQRDISEAFEVTAIANTASLTSEQATAKALSLMSNVAGGAFQIASGGAGIVTGSLALANAFTNIGNNNNGTYIGGGNGWLTFEEILNDGSGDFIFAIIKERAEAPDRNAIDYVNKFGATCDYIIDDNNNFFNYLNNKPYLVVANNQDRNIVLQLNCEVNNIPYNAAQEIEAKFNEGVRLLRITLPA